MDKMISIEAAARLAEDANVLRDHDPSEKSADFLDGYTAGLERAAALIRAYASG